MIVRLTVLLLIISLAALAQDGSNIRYIPEAEIDSTLIGKSVHFDFFRKSFGGHKTDIVQLMINGQKVSFKEVRTDNGYNNWFDDQYLKSLKSAKNPYPIRVDRARIIEITPTEIKTVLYLSYYNKKHASGKPYDMIKTTIQRSDIHTVLVSTSPQIRNGLAIYQVYHPESNFDQQEIPGCQSCLHPIPTELSNTPILGEWHIKSFDYENQKIELTKAGKKRLKNLDIPLRGLPVVLTLNGEILYGFWFWNRLSSFGCDRVFAYPKVDFSIRFGLSNGSAFGEDPRFNSKLKEYLKSK